MKYIVPLVFAWAVLATVGCTTNDFKVVEALRIGMASKEAKETILAYGFQLAKSLPRPVDGWPKERKTFDATEWRAGREEERSGKKARVEFYPVGHGLLGTGQLFLFYGVDGKLMNFYRYQIN